LKQVSEAYWHDFT